MNKKAQVGMVIVVILVIGIIAAGLYLFNSKSDSNEGRIVFAITDAAANMGSVSKVIVSVDNIQAHKVEGDSWVVISSEAKTYDLLELKQSGEFALIADTTVETGNYDQVRFDITKVTIVDANGEQEAKLPSNELKINTDLEVDNNATATASFDFLVDQSLHVTGNGKYILAPVIQVETRSNSQVEINSDNTVEISGGNVKSNMKVGMNQNGSIGVGLNIPANVNLDIDNSGIIRVGNNAAASGNVNLNI